MQQCHFAGAHTMVADARSGVAMQRYYLRVEGNPSLIPAETRRSVSYRYEIDKAEATKHNLLFPFAMSAPITIKGSAKIITEFFAYGVNR